MLTSDLFLLHAPAVYDFRERDDLLFAYLSDSDSVDVTSIYEMYPIGYFSLQQHLRDSGLKCDIINIASLMLMHPGLDVEALLRRLDAPVFGFDLHWMPQCHGAIELARTLKSIHPDALIIFGGISATYYAQELIRYPGVDVVIQGYDTLLPVRLLMQEVKSGRRRFDAIPNLIYKGEDGSVVSTGFTHKPGADYNDATVDWSFYNNVRGDLTTPRMVMTLPNTGCAYDCPWCGGSRFAYNNIMGVKKTLITKDIDRMVGELRSLAGAARNTSIYALQCYSETRERLYLYLDAVKEIGISRVFFEQFHLPDMDRIRRMAASTQAYILLSPESHDPVISKLSGRGAFSMDEMEAWIPQALDAGLSGVMVWFFIGMPRQTRQSVLETVAYCERLLRKFRGKSVLPLLCPMVPFLDPGSRFFEEPQKHGYRIFHRTLEEHRRGMLEPLWYRRLNYETEWLSRRGIQEVTYEAIAKLVTIKADIGALPQSIARQILTNIDTTTRLLGDIERAVEVDGALGADLRSEIRMYNRRILSHSSDQAVPVERPFGGRWFDDFTVPEAMIRELTDGYVSPSHSRTRSCSNPPSTATAPT
ncbi:MAG: cobalamin-dependent protein [Acidobacteriota bacterium]|nr:cobalamin-dependent protein [Acidobacteriota bacterium]